jgi:hypothetical protein
MSNSSRLFSLSVSRMACAAPLLLAMACTSPLKPGEYVPVKFTEMPEVAEAGFFPNWPAPPEQAVELMAAGEFEIREVKSAGGGTTGAEKHTLYFPGPDITFKVKWKRVPSALDGMNNAPRKELAAYEIQSVFFEPEDYVVPASVALCVPIEVVRKEHPLATPTLRNTKCVLGILSIWLQDVTVPEVLYDEERFLTDPQYAYFLSNLNLLTYLIDHRDGRDGNFLVSQDDSRRQVFAVDNGISFGPLVFNYFVPNWTKLRVAAVRMTTIEKLRHITREDLEFLKVVSQLDVDESGILRNVPPGPPIDPNGGAVARDGVVQFGLKNTEIDGIYSRIQKLIEAVDADGIPGF